MVVREEWGYLTDMDFDDGMRVIIKSQRALKAKM